MPFTMPVRTSRAVPKWSHLRRQVIPSSHWGVPHLARLVLAVLLVVIPAGLGLAQTSGDGPPWPMPTSLKEYRSWSTAKKIAIYKQVVKSQTYASWSRKQIRGAAAVNPALGAYDSFLSWLPISPEDMLEAQMHVERFEVAIPHMTHLLSERWIKLHFPGATAQRVAAEPQSVGVPPGSGVLSSQLISLAATVATNRDSAYNYSTPPNNYDGEISLAVNPLNPNQIVSMANTWDNMGDTANCGGGTQAIFFSSDGGTTWGYTCAPRGSLYSGLSCTNEAGSDPWLAWDDQNNVYADYMSLCYNSTWSSVSGYAMVVAKSTDGGATWSPHGVIQNSYTNGQSEDKNAYIIDNNPTSPYYGRHYSCWDRSNNELIKYSTDGGVTWTEVNLPATARSSNLGCEMAVQKNGTVHLIYDGLTCGASNCTGESMYYTKSTDGGVTWSSPVLVQDFTNVISFGASSKYGPQDQRGLNPFGAIDVDNSGGPCDGSLYAVFTDDPDNNGIGTADVFVKRSTDGGATWGAAVRVNDTPNPDTSIQFHPFLKVDQSSGAIVVSWHDARNDPNNRKVDFYVARSTDCGQTWTNVQASQPSSEFNNSTISYTDENSTDNANYNPNQFGEYMGLDALNGTAYLAWTDSRQFYPGSTTDAQKENVGFTKVTFCTASAPAGLTATVPGNNAISLSWTAVSGATEYRIYRSTTSGGPYTQIGTATTTSYLDTAVNGGITYYYVVTAYTTCESPYSSEVWATATGACDAAPTFAGLQSATANGCSIDLSWSAATANCGGPVTYSVYRSTTSGFTPALANRIAAGVTGTTYSDGSGVTVGTTYYYVVRATDESNGQEDTNTVEKSAATSATGTTIPINESFATGDPPTGWSLIDGGTGTQRWTTANPRGRTPPSGITAPFEIIDSDYDGYGNSQDDSLITPAFSAAGATGVTLEFDTYYRDYNANDSAAIDVSADGGTTWTNVATWTADVGTATTASHQTFDITTQAAGSTNVKVRFHYIGLWGWYWFVDNVKVTVTATACSSTPSDVAELTARSTSGQVKLEWVNPAAPYGSTRVCRDTASYPTDPTTCTVVADKTGTAGAYDTFTDTGLTNGTTYYYTAFVDNGSGVYSGGKHVWARPFATTGKVKWAYSTGATALAPTGVYPGAIGTGGTWAVSNDRMLHAMNPTATGGDWPRAAPYAWKPAAMNGPADARPPVVPTASVPGASKVVFLGSEDGHAYAVNAETGATLWQSPLLGNILVASPSGMFTDFGGSWNLIFVGTRDATADNAMYALDAATGAVKYSFGNGGGSNGIGIISSAATVDYANNRIYFASRSRSGGSSDALWCLSFNGTGFTKLWSAALGDIDGAPVMLGGRLYVGNNAGTVYAVDPATGATIWSYTTTDGAVKGYIWPEYTTGTPSPAAPRRLYFSTTNTVWAIDDTGSSATADWSVTTIPGPSTPLAPFRDTRVYVGSTNGRLYQIDAATGSVTTSVVLGDGTAAVGGPALDVINNMAYVGSESGTVYAVQLPLQ